MVGKGSVNHNTRKFHASNTDPERSHLNCSYCNENIKSVYHDLFDDAIKLYNEKQTRNDRKIDNYYEKIRSGKQEKLFHEIILQIGNVDDMNAKSENGELAAKVLDEYMQTFQARNPNLKVFSAHLHMDEATPHLHIDFVPYTTGSTRGLDTRVSLKQALATQGFKGGSRSETEWNQWVKSEKEQLSQIMTQHDIEWEQKGTNNEHLSVLDYKKQERVKEIAVLDKDIVVIKQKKFDVKVIENIQVQKIPLMSKVMISEEDYEELTTAAKKYVVQEKQERKLKKLLKTAEKTIFELKNEITKLTKELFSFKSIKAKLIEGDLKVENAELKKKISLYERILGEHGLLGFLNKDKSKQEKIEK